MKSMVYTAREFDANRKSFVDGPGHGFGYSAGWLWPQSRLPDMKTAEGVAELCNTAYSEGYAQCQRDVQKVLGINS